MTLDELVGKYTRLRAELANAYAALFWDTRHIRRLDDEIASTAVAITQAQPLDEQTSETMPAIFHHAQAGASGYSTRFGTGLVPEDGLPSR